MRTQNRKKNELHSTKSKLLRTIRWLFIFGMLYAGCALLFVGSGVGHSYMVRQNAQYASKILTVKKADQNKKKKTSYDASKTKSITATEIWRSKQYPVNPIGRMSIPVVNIHNPLFEGFGSHNQNLSSGVVTVVPGRQLGAPNTNVVYAGHYMGNAGPAILDNLHFVKNGDSIYVTDMHRIYAYSVYYMSYSIKPKQVEVENNVKGQSIITLITCSDFNISKYGYGAHRTVVQGKLVGSVPATKSNLEQTELTDKDNQVSVTPTKTKKPKVDPVTKKVVYVRKAAKPKVYQNVSFNQIACIFTVVWAIVLCIVLGHVWFRS